MFFPRKFSKLLIAISLLVSTNSGAQSIGGGIYGSSGSSGLAIGNAVSGGGANRLLYEDGSQNLAASSVFTFDGTTLTVPSTVLSGQYFGKAAADIPTVPSYSFSGSTNYGMFLDSTGAISFSTNGTIGGSFLNSGAGLSLGPKMISFAGAVSGAADVTISRISAGLVGIGLTAAGQVTGSLSARTFIAGVGGSNPVVGTSGIQVGAPGVARIVWIDSAQSANNRLVDLFFNGGSYSFSFINDAFAAVTPFLAAVGGYAAGTTSVTMTAGTGVAALTTTGLTVTGIVTSSSTIKTGGYTIAGLPAAGTAGRRAYVTDQITACAAIGIAPTAGGALVCPVFDNGVAWVGG